MAASITGLFPIDDSDPVIEDRLSHYVLRLCGEKEKNLRTVTLSINNVSHLQDNIHAAHLCFISGSLFIDNQSTEADKPTMIIFASTVEDMGVPARKIRPTTQRLTISHFVGKVLPNTDAANKEFSVLAGSYHTKRKETVHFEVRLHFDTENRRFQNFNVPSPNTLVEVRTKWMKDEKKCSHWMIENIAYPATPTSSIPLGLPSTSTQERLFGSPTPSSSKRPHESSPDDDPPEPKPRRINVDKLPQESSPDHDPPLIKPEPINDTILLSEETQNSLPTDNGSSTLENPPPDNQNVKPKGKGKGRSHR